MHIKHFEVEGLHGFIDAKLDFFPDLTIIVGRNGSGKTSVLDLMSHLVRLDIEAIKKTKFSSATLVLSDEELGQVLICASNGEKNRSVSLTIGDAAPAELFLDSSLLTSEIIRNQGFGLLSAGSLDERTMRRLAHVMPSDNWTQSVFKIKKNIHLTFVRLDRTVLAVDSQGSISIDVGIASADLSTQRTSMPKDPIDDVIQVMRRKHLQYRRAAERIQRIASSDLIKLHFSPPSETLPKQSPTEKQLRTKVMALKHKVKSSHLIANAPDISVSIDKFFDEFEALLDRAFPKTQEAKKRIGRRTLSEETLQVMIGVKERQISELLRIFENEQEQTSRAYLPIKRYLDMAAKFLGESGKTLRFSPENLELGFVITKTLRLQESSSGAVESVYSPDTRSIKELSSGERQVLIVLTYLAFLAGNDSIFIVDEPELSLHISWQSKLIPALTELRPENCQIILATHAPEIAGRAKQHTIILRPSYLPQGDA